MFMRSIPSTRAYVPDAVEVRHSVWERTMRRLGVVIRLLAAALLALCARILTSGPNFPSELAAGIIAALLIASTLLARHGRRNEPAPGRSGIGKE